MTFLNIKALQSPGLIPGVAFQQPSRPAPQGFQAVLNQVLAQEGQYYQERKATLEPSFLSVNPQMNVRLHHQMAQKVQESQAVQAPQDLAAPAFSAFHVGMSQALGRISVSPVRSEPFQEVKPAKSLSMGGISITPGASFQDTVDFWAERFPLKAVEASESAFKLKTQHTFYDKLP